MSEKDIKNLEELARKKLEKGVSKEDALRSLQNAGILNRQGNFTAPYKHLGKAVTSKEQ
jgi:hypothetical protein